MKLLPFAFILAAGGLSLATFTTSETLQPTKAHALNVVKVTATELPAPD